MPMHLMIEAAPFLAFPSFETLRFATLLSDEDGLLLDCLDSTAGRKDPQDLLSSPSRHLHDLIGRILPPAVAFAK